MGKRRTQRGGREVKTIKRNKLPEVRQRGVERSGRGGKEPGGEPWREDERKRGRRRSGGIGRKRNNHQASDGSGGERRPLPPFSPPPLKILFSIKG